MTAESEHVPSELSQDEKRATLENDRRVACDLADGTRLMDGLWRSKRQARE